ncbi:MAG: substrate-binding domain-containing protein [Chitinispirillaceae bacterium]|nr:substrate-binding domain-containing protein [Chitinispirillaceae bacterium]
MKNPINVVVALWMLAGATASNGQENKGTITLSGAWAIYPTAVAWGEAFQKINPGVKINVSAGGVGKGVADVNAGLSDIGMVSRDPNPDEVKKGIVPVYVLHDAVFPVVSDKNPVLDDLLKKGIKKETWTAICVNGTVAKWDEATGKKVNRSMNVYTRSDICGAAAVWAAFLGKKQEDLRGIGVDGDPGLLEAVRRDPIGIGYLNFSYVFTREGSLVPGIRLVPIDANNDGVADAGEAYASRADAIKAIHKGIYPATRRNYFFVKGKPQGIVKAFIGFALSNEGAKIVEETRTSLPLSKEERMSALMEIQK